MCLSAFSLNKILWAVSILEDLDALLAASRSLVPSLQSSFTRSYQSYPLLVSQYPTQLNFKLPIPFQSPGFGPELTSSGPHFLSSTFQFSTPYSRKDCSTSTSRLLHPSTPFPTLNTTNRRLLSTSATERHLQIPLEPPPTHQFSGFPNFQIPPRKGRLLPCRS